MPPSAVILCQLWKILRREKHLGYRRTLAIDIHPYDPHPVPRHLQRTPNAVSLPLSSVRSSSRHNFDAGLPVWVFGWTLVEADSCKFCARSRLLPAHDAQKFSGASLNPSYMLQNACMIRRVLMNGPRDSGQRSCSGACTISLDGVPVPDARKFLLLEKCVG